MGFFKQYSSAFVVLLIGLLAATMLYFSYDYGRTTENTARLKDQVALQKANLALSEQLLALKGKQAEVTTKVVTKYLDRVQTIKVKGETIIKEVPTYVTEVDNAHCTVPGSFGVLWNEANNAGNEVPVPESASGTDAAAAWIGDLSAEAKASGISLSDIATQHVVESQYTLDLEQRLGALQEWVREQRKLAETP